MNMARCDVDMTLMPLSLAKRIAELELQLTELLSTEKKVTNRMGYTAQVLQRLYIRGVAQLYNRRK